MQFVNKGTAPIELQNWISTNQGTANFGFEYLDGVVKGILRMKLLSEQFYICCYTGLRLSEKNNHIEHMIPQSDSMVRHRPDETVAYSNMVICDNSNDFGARFKADWPKSEEAHLFVKPTEISCKSRFVYNRSGSVSSNSGDTAAQTTIEKLNLNHAKLSRIRINAINNLFFFTPKGDTDYRKFLKRSIDRISTPVNGKYEELSFVLVQILTKKLDSLENR